MEILLSMFRFIIFYWFLGKVLQFLFRGIGRSNYSRNYSRSGTGFGFTKDDPYKVLNVSPFSNDSPKSEVFSSFKDSFSSKSIFSFSKK